MTPPPPDDTPTTRFPRVEDGPRHAARPEQAPEGDTTERTPTLLEQMGGVPGIVASTVPVLVFVVVNVITSLTPALWAAIGAGVLVLVWRLVRKDPIQPAISGLIGVGVCALVANQTGEARGFYLPGLLYSAFLGVVALVSVVVRWPLAGVIWHGINGHGQGWRQDPVLLRAYTWATSIWAFVFAARVVVQGLLYGENAETLLGIARLAMGYPLLGVAILATVLIVRRAERSRAATA
ncbi:DUF3159 domain-containing protein [Pseudonocardia endophytica]|uniref:Uncharacterized protein DUF3159 n=1 Tax=Pseudonocardia endophytica TaxID=401976 RepID=A0A4R1HTQ7_PSEEN|nr:DUF3159 domain-containing protein [Pseudonocardia endophytica]TCK24771.1 uncharacterized protein DUF3159 [Pseudonocardia endophytica]